LAAFIVGSAPASQGFLLAGAHTDSPGFKVKELSGQAGPGGFRYAVEMYGGPIVSTWLDRDLSLAGAVMVLQDGRWMRQIVSLDDLRVVIPNLAIHFNREINEGIKYNPQEHLAFLAGDAAAAGDPLKSALAAALDVPGDSLGPGDLFLYSPEPGRTAGLSHEFFAAPRIDNLAGCHAVLSALERVESPKKGVGAFFFDNEEVGSTSLQGANSSFIRDMIDRISLILDGDGQAAYQARANSLLFSVDGAHAVHPNYQDKHDKAYAPSLNGGPVIKSHASFKYATTAAGTALLEELCAGRNIPVQRFAIRSDLACGSTIGPLSSSLSGIPTQDIGIPMLAMHSIRETAGNKDQGWMISLLEGLFNLD
jgi:aspartyl aminopeptidase